MRRSLTLKRETLAELTADDLADVNGGTRQTAFSCYAFISCYPWQCVTPAVTTAVGPTIPCVE